MPYNFSVVAYKDWGNRNHPGVPEHPQDARGVKVVATNPDDSGDTHQFWNYTLQPFQSWPEWWVYIGGIMEDHGLELSDEPPPDDDLGPGGDYDDEEEEEEEEEPAPTSGPIRQFFHRIGRFFRRGK